MNSGPLTQTLWRDIGFTLLSEGKTIKVKANGYSMYPSVKPGSVIYIEPLGDAENPSAGEVLAWKRDSGFIVHRLVRSYEEGGRTLYVTRGDSCTSEDSPFFSEHIAGRVVRIENPDGKLVLPHRYEFKKPNYRFNRFLLRVNLYAEFTLKKVISLLSAR